MFVANILTESKLEEEARVREAKRKERDEQHLYINAKVVTDETYRAHSGTDLATFPEAAQATQSVDLAAAKTYRILRTTTIQAFATRIAAEVKQDPRRVRFWVMVNRQNKTIRPDQPVTDPNMTVEDAYHKFASSKLQELRLWTEIAQEIDEAGEPIWPNTPTGIPPRTDNILLFLKWFDVEQQTLRGAGTIYISKEKKVEDLCPLILKKMGWSDKLPSGDRNSLKLYEVLYNRLPDLISSILTLSRKSSHKW